MRPPLKMDEQSETSERSERGRERTQPREACHPATDRIAPKVAGRPTEGHKTADERER